MKIEKYIEKIVKNGSNEQMEELADMLEDLIYKLKESDPECFKEYKTELFGMAYNYKFDKESSEEIVDDMKPSGEIWDFDTTSQVKRQYGINADDYDFYIVINSLGNDYGKVIPTTEVETYVKIADAFINDQDADEKKVWKYFNSIPK